MMPDDPGSSGGGPLPPKADEEKEELALDRSVSMHDGGEDRGDAAVG